MPELPEVETIRRQLSQHLPGLVLEKIELLDPKIGQFLTAENLHKIVNQEIMAIKRVAKILLWEFHNKNYLAFHLKMTGQVILKSEHLTHLPNGYTRAILHLKGGAIIYFQDLRKFGWLKVVSQEELVTKLLKDKIGPEPLQPEFTLEYFREVVKKSGKPVKTLLLDQSKLAGVGNIYANEALFLAKIDPHTKGKDLDDTEIGELYAQLLLVLEKGIKLGGASDNSYVNAYGLKGEFQNHFLVYRQQGKPCSRCGKLITRISLGGRGTFYCPNCQK